MKKALTVLALAMLFAMPAHAATSQAVPVSASVNSVLDLTMTVKDRATGTDLPTGSALASIAYGQLVNNGFSALVGSTNKAIFLGTNTSSRKYAIDMTMPALSNGTTTLPNAMGVAVVNSVDANNVAITGDTKATIRSAITNNTRIYQSNNAGTGGTIELWTGIAGYGTGGTSPFTGFAPVPQDQASGSYTSTMTFTIVLT